MPRSAIGNLLLGFTSAIGFLAVVVAFDLGCTGSDDNKGPVATVEITPPATTLSVGGNTKLKAVTRLANGTEVTGRFCTWFASNDNLVTISEKGDVYAVAEGTVTITAVCEQKTGTAQVTVSPAAVASVEVTPIDPVVKRDYTIQMMAVVKDAAGNILANRPITWSIGGTCPNCASVSQQGLVTGLQEGTALVIAASGEKSDAESIDVTANPVVRVVVEPSSLSLSLNSSTALNARTFDS